MKKITLKVLLVVLFCLLSGPYTVKAQELTFEVPLNVQVHASSQIIEGKVISKKSYWDANGQNIYTVNKVEVYKVFKGQELSVVEIVTVGGTVGLDAQIVTPSLQLDLNDVGVFTLVDNTVSLPSEYRSFETYSDTQGFYKYNVFNNIVINPYGIKENIADFYNDIVSLTNSNYSVISQFNADQTANRGGAAIVSISPTTATAGTQTVLTINGAGFGTTVQNVGFADANDGGAGFTFALESQILSWTDTQITVQIPSRAGTGQVAIINSAATAILAASAQTLNIEYAEINAVSDAITTGVNVAYPTQHQGDNGAGGYTWQMFTDFDANNAANASFVRALNSWRCETEVNWIIGPVTTTDVVANDGINIVRMDNGDELPNGVLGRCTSRFSGCFISGGTSLQWFVSELDIAFNDTTNWQFGPSAPSFSQFDFESVAVHELGHGHQLAHVIDTNVVMHYAISNGESQRSLSAGDINGGGDVHSRSTTNPACGNPLMQDFDCSILSVSDETLNAAISIYPNPSKGEVYINNSGFIDLDTVKVYDVNGRLILEQELKDTPQNRINLTSVSNGVYFLIVNSNEASITEKLIIE